MQILKLQRIIRDHYRKIENYEVSSKLILYYIHIIIQ